MCKNKFKLLHISLEYYAVQQASVLSFRASLCFISMLSNHNRLLLVGLNFQIVAGFSESLMCAEEEMMKGKFLV